MKEHTYFDNNFGARRKRKTAVKAVIALLDDIRNAECKALDNTPENFQCSENYEAGELAVDALDEAIALLADVY
jgi:hypothetical protein